MTRDEHQHPMELNKERGIRATLASDAVKSRRLCYAKEQGPAGRPRVLSVSQS
jgi:hypothetical protein